MPSMARSLQTDTRVPAWKRIGLKLANQNEPKKRNFDDGMIEQSTTSESLVHEPPVKRRKSVKFSDDVNTADGSGTQNLLAEYMTQQQGGEGEFSKEEASEFQVPVSHPANPTKRPQKPKTTKKKKRPKGEEQPTSGDEPEYINYLVQFFSDKSHWKFNKHHQTSLLKHAFDDKLLPTQHYEAFLSYIKDLQGQARQRLSTEATNIVNDFESSVESMEDPAAREEARNLALKRQLLETKIRIREAKDEKEYETPEFQEKLKKRKRAEFVLECLANSGIKLPSSQEASRTAAELWSDTKSLAPINSVTRSLQSESHHSAVTIRRIRHKKTRTGVTDDDAESVSSVDSNSLQQSSDEESSESESEDSDSSSNTSDSGSESDSEDSSVSGSSDDDSVSDSDSN